MFLLLLKSLNQATGFLKNQASHQGKLVVSEVLRPNKHFSNCLFLVFLTWLLFQICDLTITQPEDFPGFYSQGGAQVASGVGMGVEIADSWFIDWALKLLRENKQSIISPRTGMSTGGGTGGTQNHST